MNTVIIGDVCELIRGVSYKKNDASNVKSEENAAILRANNIVNGCFEFNELVFVPKSLVKDEQYIKKNEIMITMSSGSKAHVGKVAIASTDMNCAFGAFCGKLIPHRELLSKYLYYLLIGSDFRTHIEQQCKGTNINNIKRDYILGYKIDLPSLEEQERIVTRIEELFSQLDSGVETLKKTKAQLAVYRQAVLKEAFSKFNQMETVRKLSSIVTSGSRGWAKYYSDKGAMFIRIGNLTRSGINIDFNDVQYVALPDKAEGIRSLLKPNDVLVSITADLGSIGLVPEHIGEAYINQHIALVRFKNPYQAKFMALYLRSDFGQKELLKNKRGAGKPGLGLDDIRDSKVPVVTDEQADRTVAEIESRLSVCDSIEQTIDSALQEAEALRQSILKRAFEGGLQ